jgi:hypothetical protein
MSSAIAIAKTNLAGYILGLPMDAFEFLRYTVLANRGTELGDPKTCLPARQCSNRILGAPVFGVW